MADFSENTLACLARAGWSEDYRCPNLAAFEQLLTADGYTVFPCVHDFLSRFGGLEISEAIDKMPRVEISEGPGGCQSFHISQRRTVGPLLSFDITRVKAFDEDIADLVSVAIASAGQDLCPIGIINLISYSTLGTSDHNAMLLLMDNAGRVHAAETELWCYLLGVNDSGEMAIESLLGTGSRRFRRIRRGKLRTGRMGPKIVGND